MNQIYNLLTVGLCRGKGKEDWVSTGPLQRRRDRSSHFTAIMVVFLLSCFGAVQSYAQTTYYSAATATDFNNLASWGTATDGTGTAPAAISNADNFVIANNAALSLSANATVRQLTISTGSSLTVAANTLTVSKAGTFDSTLAVNTGGTLTFTGGAINVNGNVFFQTGSNFSQSGGTLTVDGNNGGSATGSVASGTPIFSFGLTTATFTTGTVSLTGGSIVIVDPHAATTASYSLLAALASNTMNVTATADHTIQLGNGTSTDAGGNAVGFNVDFWYSTGALKAGKYVIDTNTGTNRHVTQVYKAIIGSNLTVNSGELRFTGAGPYNVAGNVLVNAAGTLTTSVALALSDGTYTSSTAITNSPVLVPQTVSGTGVFRNSTTTTTAHFGTIHINNTSSAGVTFTMGGSSIATQPSNSVSISSTLNFIAGKASATGGARFILGVSGTAGTVTYTAGGFTSGTTFGRWFTNTGTGTSFTAGSDATTGTSRYPFATASGMGRSAWIERVTPTAAGGVLAITYNEVPGTTAINAVDGAYTANIRTNDTWAVSDLSGTPLSAASFRLQIQAPGIFGAAPVAPNVRVIQGNTFVGTHQAGTVTPGGQRVGLLPAELTAAPFSLALNSSELPIISVASGNWDSPATWSTGSVPGCTDSVAIAAGHTVTVNSAGNNVSNAIVGVGGILEIASGSLTVGCTNNNSSLTNNGTLTVSGGTLNVNGNMLHNAGATFNQSGGDINVDGNNAGDAVTSVASGTAIVQINTPLLNWTGGMLTIVDPHASTTASNSFAYNNSTTHVNITGGHTLRLGNGVSSDAGGNATNGFRLNTWVGSNRIAFFNVIVNGGLGTNRHVTTTYSFGILGNLDVTINSEFRDNATTVYVAGNVTNTGTYIGTGTLYFGTFLSGTATPALTEQTLNATGTFSNSLTTQTAELVSMTVNNTSTQGVNINAPLSLSGTLNLTAGKVNTTSSSLLKLGTDTTTGTLTGGSATAYINGPFARTILTGNANTNYIFFPVGTAVYAPIWLAPATTSVVVMKAQAFDSNTGTDSASIMDLATGRRWEAPLVSGTVTDVNVRLGGTFVADNIPVMAPSAAGVYDSVFGSTATFVAGPPTTIQSTTAATNYTGFISYAKSNLCVGTPAPGATIASANNICAGASVTLSVANDTMGSGVTYQWQSSPDGVTYTDIPMAMSSTYTTTPLASAYYQLKVTCSAGPSTGTSTPVQVNFSNQVTATVPATRCGEGTVTLSATGSTGTDITWYSAQTGGDVVGSGSTFTTPAINTTTTYYAAAQSGFTQNNGGKLAPESSWTGFVTNNWGIVFTAIQSTVLQSVDIYSTSSGTIDVKVTNSAGVELYSTGNIAVTAGGVTTPTVIPLNFAITAGTEYKVLVKSYTGVNLIRGGTNLAFPYTNADISVTSSEWGGTTTTTYYFFYNFVTTSGCSSARVPVVATVTAPPALTLSGNTATICAGQSTPAVTLTAGAADYDTYVWSPSAGVSGNATTGWTFNPTTTTTYTLTASQSTGAMCVAPVATVAVTVNETPTAVVIAPVAATNCNSNAVALQATGGAITIQGTIGQATTLTGDTDQPTAFNNRWTNYTMQTIYTAAELNAAGIQAGSLNSLAFEVATLGSAANNTNLTIKIGTAAAPSFATTTFVSTTDFATVYGPQTFVHTATGWQTLVFDTPYVWDGTSDILVNITMGGANSTNNTQTYFTQTTDNTVLWANSVTAATGTLSNKRLNARFTATNPGPVTWTPATDLYTDAAATIPYIAGTAASTVYVKTNATGTVQYTATSTALSNCTATAVVDVNFVNCGIDWGNLQWPPTGNITTCGGHQVYAQVYKLGVTEAAGQAAGMQAWIGVNTSNTDPATWAESSWQLATFNVQAGNNDEFTYTITGLPAGTYYYASRFRYLDGANYYGGLSGQWNAATSISGVLTVTGVDAPTAAATQNFCGAPTVADLSATGTGIQWYADATGGTALATTDVLVNGANYFASQTVGGCESTRTEVVVAINNVAVTAPDDVTACDSYTLPALTTGNYYTAANGGGTMLNAGNAITSTQTIFVYAQSGTTPNCTAEDSFTVTITVTPSVTAPADTTVCDSYMLPALTTGNYYTATNGGGAMLNAGDFINSTQTVYVYAANGSCTAEDSFVVTVNTVADVTAPDDVTVCESYTLPALTTGNYYTAANGGGTMLNAGDAITSTQTIFVYAQSGTTPNCTSEDSFTVTVNTQPVVTAPADVTLCNDTYELPALTTGMYHTATNGGGTMLMAGDVISTTQTIYVYAANGSCTAEESFTVTINNVAAPTGNDTQIITVNTADEATIDDIVVNETGVIWYDSEDDAINGIDALGADTQLVSGNTYYGTITVGNCTSAPFAVTVQVVLGTEGFDFANFSYYPNPVKNVLTVKYSSDITSVTVHNLLGQQVMFKNVNATETGIDMSALADGTYIVNVTAGNAVKTIKVIKKQ